MDIHHLELEKIIRRALEEDIGSGDLTTNVIVPPEALAKGIIYAKETGIVAGLPVAHQVFTILDPSVSFHYKKKDGDTVEAGDVLAEVEGSTRVILAGERTALNLLQRLSGIATKTARVVDLITYYHVDIVDTRKTTPGLRILEKYAVRVGGGRNHRFGLYDAVLIKDNHLKIAGGIKPAIALARKKAPFTTKIEVEVENLEALQEALEAKADIIMLDNMELDIMKEAVKITAGRALLEASGGINEEQIIDVAKTGVNLISLGALTHSVKAMDISLDIGEVKSRGVVIE